MTTREELHELVDRLPEADVEAALKLLGRVPPRGSRLVQLLADAPVDDEPESVEEKAGAAEARRELKEGKWDDSETIRADLADRA